MGARAFAHQRDVLVHHRGKRAQPRDPIFVILDRFKAEPIAQLVESLQAAALVDRHQVGAEFGSLDLGLEIFFEQVVVELIRRRKLRAIDLAQARERGSRVLFVLPNRLETSVRPPIVPAAVTERGSTGRILFHRVVPFRFEKSIERFAGIAVGAFVFRSGCDRQLQGEKNRSRDGKFS